MYDKSEFPNTCNDSLVHFIGKPDGNEVRPIFLTSWLSKTFEKMLKISLAFARLCIDNMTNLTFEVDEGLDKKKDVLAAFLDVSGASNNILHDILLSRLVDNKCSEKEIRFAKFLTYERWIRTNIKVRELTKKKKKKNNNKVYLLSHTYIPDIYNLILITYTRGSRLCLRTAGSTEGMRR